MFLLAVTDTGALGCNSFAINNDAVLNCLLEFVRLLQAQHTVQSSLVIMSLILQPDKLCCLAVCSTQILVPKNVETWPA